jgi:pathogenesis-related protein 1
VAKYLYLPLNGRRTRTLPAWVLMFAAGCASDDTAMDVRPIASSAGRSGSDVTASAGAAADGDGKANVGTTSDRSRTGSQPLASAGSSASPMAAGGRSGSAARSGLLGAGGASSTALGGRAASASAGTMNEPMSGAGGAGDAASGETGRMIGMTAAHNAVRAMVQTTPPLLPMTWSPTLAAYAQEWTDELASNQTTCAQPMHRSGQDLQRKRYGENLAASGSRPARMTTLAFAIDGWSGEVACYTYGTILGSEQCDTSCYMSMHSDGCGHYTQLVWRDSLEVGCGVSTCTANGITYDIWVCNYSQPGNVVGRTPY